MKGIATVPDVLTMIILTAFFLFMVFIVLPEFASNMFKNFSYASPETVSRELSSFITLSAAAPEKIKIYYNPSESVLYNIIIEERILKVQSLGKEKGIASAKISVDPSGHYESVNDFVIEKYRENGKNIYNLEANEK